MLLSGSWVVITGVISPLIWLISVVTLLKTLLILPMNLQVEMCIFGPVQAEASVPEASWGMWRCQGIYRAVVFLGGVGPNVSIWVVVKIMVPFWVPVIVRHLIFRVPKKRP